MNPQELVNQDVKANANNFRALVKMEDLTINVRYYLTRIQFNSFKIKHLFKKRKLNMPHEITPLNHQSNSDGTYIVHEETLRRTHGG